MCSRYGKICPNYKAHQLEKIQPTELFCARKKSSCPDKKEIRCFSPGCEIFTNYHLRVGFFCINGQVFLTTEIGGTGGGLTPR